MARLKAKLIKLSRDESLVHHLELLAIERKYQPSLNADYTEKKRLDAKRESELKEYLEYNGLTSMQGDLYVEDEEY